MHSTDYLLKQQKQGQAGKCLNLNNLIFLLLIITDHIIKLKALDMHFTKFLTVSQLQNNAQIIAQHLNKPFSSPKENHLETQSPKARKRISNLQPTIYNSSQSSDVNSNQIPHNKLSAFATLENQTLSNQHSPKNRAIPIDPGYEKRAYIPYSRSRIRKHSQNIVIYQNEQAERQDDDEAKLNIWPKKGSKVNQPKFSLKDRKASCNLQKATFFKNPNRKHSDHSSQLANPTREKILIKKKSHGWDQNNNFRFSSSNATSEGKSQGQIYTNALPQTPKLKNLRKQSENADSPKKQVPSFITNSKNHRNSIDAAELIQKKKLSIQDFLIIKQLGKGAFGRVVLAAEKQSKMICAIKIMSKRQLRENNMIQQLVKEIKIQMFISHPNIVKIHGFFDDLLHFYILIECALDGHLSQYIKRTANPIAEVEAGIMMYQICSAVSLLHSQKIIHRDLKPQNVLLHDGVIKICDFGWSVRRNSKLRTTFCGTPVYLCPEILIGDQYDQSVDIWTIGIILYQMVYKTNPFKISVRQDLLNILNNPIDFKQQIAINKMTKDFIELCLAKRAVQRPNIRQLMLHEFILRAQAVEQQRLKS